MLQARRCSGGFFIPVVSAYEGRWIGVLMALCCIRAKSMCSLDLVRWRQDIPEEFSITIQSIELSLA